MREGGRSGNYFLSVLVWLFNFSLRRLSSPSVVFVLVGGLGVTLCFNACILHSVCVFMSQSALPSSHSHPPETLEICLYVVFSVCFLTLGGGQVGCP